MVYFLVWPLVSRAYKLSEWLENSLTRLASLSQGPSNEHFKSALIA